MKAIHHPGFKTRPLHVLCFSVAALAAFLGGQEIAEAQDGNAALVLHGEHLTDSFETLEGGFADAGAGAVVKATELPEDLSPYRVVLAIVPGTLDARTRTKLIEYRLDGGWLILSADDANQTSGAESASSFAELFSPMGLDLGFGSSAPFQSQCNAVSFSSNQRESVYFSDVTTLRVGSYVTVGGGETWIENRLVRDGRVFLTGDSALWTEECAQNQSNQTFFANLWEIISNDEDADHVSNDVDNCPEIQNADQDDQDQDGLGDACDADHDNDLIPNDVDNCPSAFNPGQSNADSDNLGDACDNCPEITNPNQEDVDFDGTGDLCDLCPEFFSEAQTDTDGDGLGDACDNCPEVHNADQADSDIPALSAVATEARWRTLTENKTIVALGNNEGSAAVPIHFGFPFFGVDYSEVYISSNGFLSFVSSGLADASPQAIPNNGTPSAFVAGLWTDLSPASGGTISYETLGFSPNREFVVEYSEVVVNAMERGTASFQIILRESDARAEIQCAACNTLGLAAVQGIEAHAGTSGVTASGRNNQAFNVADLGVIFNSDALHDGVGDACDTCPHLLSDNQADEDGDGLGDLCDNDSDNDSVADEEDNCPTTPNEAQSDLDSDGAGDACDDDIDADGQVNEEDNCPTTPNGDQEDADSDNVGDPCDNCPGLGDPDQTDSDGDGAGNPCDEDDDNDGYEDAVDFCFSDGSRALDVEIVDFRRLTANGDTLEWPAFSALTSGRDNETGSAFYPDPIPFSSSTAFSVFFGMDDVRADGNGMALVLHSDGPNALGQGGSGLGYHGIANSIAIELDMLQDTENDPEDQHVALTIDGDSDNHLVSAPLDGLDLDRDEIFVWVDYDFDQTLSVFVHDRTSKPEEPLFTTTVDIHAFVGDAFYLGFTASAGSGQNDGRFRVLDLEFAFDDPGIVDRDEDGFGDLCDNCPGVSNAGQDDNDGDGLGDACDDDHDNDGVANAEDNCPEISNPAQNDNDEDGLGDLCDEDDDNDGVLDEADNCPLGVGLGANQADSDEDGVGDLCDNCLSVPNLDQRDKDQDGLGNLCDLCPFDANPGQDDDDEDGVGDACDVCPEISNPAQNDLDGDGEGDLCDQDIDGDGVFNAFDKCTQVDAGRAGFLDEDSAALYGGAAFDADGSLLIHDATLGQTRGALSLASPVFWDDARDFSVKLQYESVDLQGGFNLTLVLHSDDRGAVALRDQGFSGVSPSYGIRMSYTEELSSLVALEEDGAVVGRESVAVREGNLLEGAVYVWMDYSAEGKALSFYYAVNDPEKPAVPHHTYLVDLGEKFGNDLVHIGLVYDDASPESLFVNTLDAQFWNIDQSDTDGDGAGDACDEDDDGDKIPDEEDNCPLVVNIDRDPYACEDNDQDSVPNAYDLCPDYIFDSNAPATKGLLTLNNDARPEEGDIVIAERGGSVGSVFLHQPIPVNGDTSFRSAFELEFKTDNAGAAFIVQNVDAGRQALGEGNSRLGYGGMGEQSFAVEFDLVTNSSHSNDIDDNHAAVIFGGDLNNFGAVETVPFAMDAGDPFFVWVEYDGPSDLLSVYVAESNAKPEEPLLTETVDLVALVGDQIYPGFSASIFSGSAHQFLLNAWTFDVYNRNEADSDEDGVGDSCDNCPGLATSDLSDLDADGIGDACDICPGEEDPDQIDSDEDGPGDACDNCPQVANADQNDIDEDGFGDLCDEDMDGDGILNEEDLCPSVFDPEQADLDRDEIGDLCDDDLDGDGALNEDDLCPEDSASTTEDLDGDGVGDTCDPCPLDNPDDADDDGLCESDDNCPGVFNPTQVDEDEDGAGDACDNCLGHYNTTQSDADTDGEGDACDADDDNDEIVDIYDLCPLDYDPDQQDTDDDNEGDACDTDDDNDGIPDTEDNCPLSSNTAQVDTDNDDAGDACDADDDNDGVIDRRDTCPLIASGDQTDTDRDGDGNLCDEDDDNDGILDVDDLCPLVPGSDQTDSDEDGEGDACDDDNDNDGISNGRDNCPFVASVDQTDSDEDGEGDACDEDDDNDGVPDEADNCPTVASSDQTDLDEDGEGDACDPDDDNDGVEDDVDNCPRVAGEDQGDPDSDGYGNPCDEDDDNDGVPDEADNCPLHDNPSQGDNDEDGTGNTCDDNDDNDSILDNLDNCPFVQNDSQTDTDGDGRGDACESDDDADNIADALDNCPLAPNAEQSDLDGDGEGDACDEDDDNDGIPDSGDSCVLQANPEQVDSDSDGAGDACDEDDDNDGVLDRRDNCPLEENPDQADLDEDLQGDACDEDLDGDGVGNGEDNCPGVKNADQSDGDLDGLGNACDDLHGSGGSDADADNDGIFDEVDNCPTTSNADQEDADEDGTGDACDVCPEDVGARENQGCGEPEPVVIPDIPESSDSSTCQTSMSSRTPGSALIFLLGAILFLRRTRRRQ